MQGLLLKNEVLCLLNIRKLCCLFNVLVLCFVVARAGELGDDHMSKIGPTESDDLYILLDGISVFSCRGGYQLPSYNISRKVKEILPYSFQ